MLLLSALAVNCARAADYIAPYAAGSVTIDGKLEANEWDDCQPVRLNYHELVANVWQGPEDTSGKAYFKWDEKFLYFALAITDDVHFSAAAPGSMWQEDSVQIAADPEHDRSAGYNTDDYEYGFALGQGGAMLAGCWRHPQNSAAPKMSICLVERDESKNLTTYEGAFAWEDLSPLRGEEGVAFGFTLLVNDNDGQGRDGWLEWTEGLGLSKNPSQFATMILAAKGDAKTQASLAPELVITPVVTKSKIGNSPDNSTLQGKIFVQSSEIMEKIDLQLFLSKQGERVVRLPVERESNGALASIDFSWPQVGLNVGAGEYELGALQKGEEVTTKRLKIQVIDTMDSSRKVDLISCYTRKLGELIEQLEANELDPSYPKVTYRLAQDFVNYAQDDLSADKLERGLNVLAYLESTLPSAIQEAQKMLDGTINPKYKTVPPYRTGPIAIRDGAFYREQQPIIFTGVGHFAQVRKDVPILAEYGFNLIQIENGPRSIVLENGYNDAPINELLSVLRSAAEHNIAVNLLLSPHYFPTWAKEKFGDPQEGVGFLRGINLFDPRTREVYERFLNYLIPKIAAEPALHSFCLMNEPTYEGTSAMSQNAFRNWLQKKYSDIQSLNRTWSSDYQSFAEIRLPQETRAGKFDQGMFNQERFLEFAKWMAGIIEKLAPGVPVHIKVMGFGTWMSWDDPHSSFRYGVNQVDFARVGKIAGNDNQIFLGRDGFAQDWLTCAMGYELQRSATGAPIFNSENHLILDNDGGRYYPPSHIRTALWQQAINGQGASTLWVWERGESTNALKDNLLTRPECVEAAGRTALDLRRLAEIVVEFPRAPREVALVYSSPALLSADYAADTKAVYQALSYLDLPVDFVIDQDFEQGLSDLTKYKAIIFPSVESASAETVAEIEKYLAQGGKIVLTGSSLRTNEWGKTQNYIADLQAKAPAGSVIIREKSTSELYRYFFESLLNELQVNRSVRLDVGTGKLPWGIVLRSVTKGGKCYVNVVNYLNAEQTISLRKGGKIISQAIDVISGQTIEFPLAIESLRPYLFEINL